MPKNRVIENMFDKIISKFPKSRVIIRNLSTTPRRCDKGRTSLMTHCDTGILEVTVKRKTIYSFTKPYTPE